ncbi:DUF6128 domain-containing protein [Anaerosacchariphilus polymeriproducens]|uniref:DUF6128 domain-containing protein n=1 Tax=Anaerosacchariphilus polymeriproducens TaxID=1812858 RepID=A0A371AV78_9FIRM|nr:DUF6128 domain-containing protein [Anaerosacchariphilus polymeriproducens]RDU23478.1 hypothetical protein DWV06_09270 [Anaerosacchariphilus polymeriproducens]
MSDYKRFVSYFYPYTPDKQPRSVGFVKIEIRNNKMKLEAQVKGIISQTEKQYPIYLFFDDGSINSLHVGNLKIQKNGGVFRRIMEEESKEEKLFFANTIGTIIQGEEKILYIAYWGKKTFAINEIAKMLKVENSLAANVEEKSKNESEIIEVKDIKIEDSVSNLKTAVIEDKEKDLELAVIEDVDNDSETTVIEEEENDIEIAVIEEPESDLEENNRFENEAFISKLEVPIEMKEKQFEQKVQGVFKEKKETKKASDKVMEELNLKEEMDQEKFFENPNFFECQKIEPRDLRILPEKEWILGKNSFLLHGYYNYRYLLYGKVNNGSTYTFLGVPGVFHNQEKFMANLFGFSEFEPAKKEKIKTGKFGYWIRIIDKLC